MEQSNNPVPSYYLSDMQYSRLYALAYLDENLRQDAIHGKAYAAYAADRIRDFLTWGEAELIARLAELVGGSDSLRSFYQSIPDAEMYFKRYCQHTKCLLPEQSFKDALEENQFWAATNSIVYILNIHAFAAGLKVETGAVLLNNNLHDHPQKGELGKRVILNMMFINPVRIDPVPSVLDGYSFSTLDDIINNKNNRAITLPSNATCC